MRFSSFLTLLWDFSHIFMRKRAKISYFYENSTHFSVWKRKKLSLPPPSKLTHFECLFTVKWPMGRDRCVCVSFELLVGSFWWEREWASTLKVSLELRESSSSKSSQKQKKFWRTETASFEAQKEGKEERKRGKKWRLIGRAGLRWGERGTKKQKS